MRKTSIFFCFLSIAVLLTACRFYGTEAQAIQELSIDGNQSWFDDYVISGETVLIECHVCLLNQTDVTKRICMTGDFSEDQKNGLLKEQKLIAQQKQNPGQTQFELSPGENQFDILFVGTPGGNVQKANRLLPAIEIFPINQS